MESIRMSPGAQRVMTRAAERSDRLSQYYLGVEHLFVSLRDQESIPLAKAFESHELSADRFFKVLERRMQPVKHRSWGDEILFTPRCRDVLRLASKIAAREGSKQVRETHLLEAIFREGRSVPIRLLRSFDVPVADFYEALAPQPAEPLPTATPVINEFGRDLTAQARARTLTPLIGRSRELDLLAQVLLRRNKNNPVLVGEAGVGKTAVVEGLAQSIASPSCPQPLEGCRLVELSMTSLVAGTKYRGSFEERLVAVLREAASDDKLILFLDEMHMLVGAGSAVGETMDAANIFKPALSRGELRCIGATTLDEYRRFIERDAALERRFEPIMIEEPTPEEAQAILEGVARSLEEHHEVTLTPEALQRALDLTVRYMPNRRLPDKAIDALDQSCARVRLQVHGRGEVDTGKTIEVDAEAIARTVSQWTGIPIERISGEQARGLLELEDELRRRVVGQDRAVKAVTRAVLTSRAGLADPDRPAGVFLFLGPTGVGKTELARSLAALVFGDEKRLVRFDMSEYTEPHSVAKLIGSPPGYVGYEKEGLLISAVRTHPHSVVLFDELEKAHSQVFDLFLQIFDEGKLSGAHGVGADFRNAIVIMTSNLDPALLKPRRPVGFVDDASGQTDADPRQALIGHFRPELVNRIDEVVVFKHLGKPELRKIIDRYVNSIERLAAERSLTLTLDEPVYDHLIELSASELFGARELRRIVDTHLRQPLARELLRRPGEVGSVRVFVEGAVLKLAWS